MKKIKRLVRTGLSFLVSLSLLGSQMTTVSFASDIQNVEFTSEAGIVQNDIFSDGNNAYDVMEAGGDLLFSAGEERAERPEKVYDREVSYTDVEMMEIQEISEEAEYPEVLTEADVPVEVLDIAETSEPTESDNLECGDVGLTTFTTEMDVGSDDAFISIYEENSIEETYADVAVVEEVQNASVDMTQYITSAVFNPENLSSVTDYMKITLNYTISNTVLQEKGTNQLVYQLPSTLKLTDSTTGVVNDGTKAVGTFVVDTDGKITITFYDEYVNGETADIDGALTFFAQIDQSAADEQGKINVSFNDKVNTTVTIPVQQTSNYDLAMDKECTGVTVIDNSEGQKEVVYTYSVKVSSSKGSGGDFTFTDTLQNQVAGEQFENVVVTKYDVNNQVISDSSSLQITPGTDGNGATITGNLPGLSSGEYYIVTYSVRKTMTDNSAEAIVWNSVTGKNEQVNAGDSTYTKEVLYDMSLEKECLETEITSNKTIRYYYSVVIDTTKGTGEEIVFKDQLYYKTGTVKNIVVQHYNAGATEAQSINHGLSWSNGEYGQSTIIQGTLPKLNAGQKYVVTYVIEMPESATTNGKLNLGNKAEIHTKYLSDSDENWKEESLYDLSAVKSCTSNAEIDSENNVISSKYKVVVSSTRGTNGAITLKDVLNVNLSDPTITYKDINVVKKVADGTSENVEFTAQGTNSLEGTLPQLNAGESYEIEYTVDVSNLPDSDKVSINIGNSVSAKDGTNSSGSSASGGTIDWTGSNYCDWIHKDGTYDSYNKKIVWTITLNKGAYGDLDQKTLSDELYLNRDTEPLSNLPSAAILTERKYDENGQISNVGTYNIKLPYTFENNASLTATDGTSYTIDTHNEFVVTYETPVNAEDMTAFINTYNNIASIGNESDEASVTVKKEDMLDKTFVGSNEATNESGNTIGYEIQWKSEIQIPQLGLTAGSYYRDTVSDFQTYNNERTWFTKEQLQAISLTIDGIPLAEGSYKIEGKPTNDYLYYNIDTLSDSIKIISFQVTFLKDIAYQEGKPLVIEYKSFVTDLNECYNKGEFFDKNGNSVADQEKGQAQSDVLVVKTMADGSGGSESGLEAIYDQGSGKYLYIYKLKINESHTASGDMTITDTLPKGLKFVNNVSWKTTIKGLYGDEQLIYGNKDACLNGVYFRYYPYNSYLNGYQSYELDKRHITNGNIRVEQYNTLYEENKYCAKDLGVTVQYNENMDGMTIRIPKNAYNPLYVDVIDPTITFEPSLGMALYYAVEVIPDELTDYKAELKNSCQVTTTTGQQDQSYVTNTVIGNAISKAGSYDANSAMLEYKLDINPTGTKLLEDEEGLLVVTDTLGYNTYFTDNSNNYVPVVSAVNLKPGSLQLYEISETNGVKTESLVAADSYETSLTQANNQAILVVKVPDGKHYRLEYAYEITLHEDAPQKRPDLNITNNAEISGIGSIGNTSDSAIKVNVQSGSATATKGYTEVTLYKRDAADQTILLEGAVFKLEKYDGQKWVEVGQFTTGDDGSVKLGQKTGDDSYKIAFDCAYRLTELVAPNGYHLLADERYFYVTKPTGTPSVILVPDEWNTTKYTEKLLSVSNAGRIFIENEKQVETLIDISIEKVWKNADNTIAQAGAQSIDVSIYRSTSESDMSNGTLIKDVTVKAENNWKLIVDGLEKADSNGNPYFYYVREKTSLEGWNVVYSNDKAISSENADRNFVLTNKKTEKSTAVTVKKEWYDGNGVLLTEAPQSDVTVYLKRKYLQPAATAGEVSLKVNVTDNEGTATKDVTLPAGSLVNITIPSIGYNKFSDVLTATQVIVPSYSSYHSVKIGDDWASEETVTFVIYENTTVNIGNEYCNYELDQMVVTWTAGAASTEKWVTDSSFIEERVLSAANNWSYSWNTLADSNALGNAYYYYVEEKQVEAYNTEYVYSASEGSEQIEGAITGGEITVKNSEGEKTTTDISVQKSWKYDDGTEIPADKIPANVKVKLYRSTAQQEEKPQDAEAVEETNQTLSSSNSWTYTWKDLPIKDDNENTYYYYVEEIELSDFEYESTISNNGKNSGTIVITNTMEKPLSITVEKVWADGNANHTDENGKVEVQLYSSLIAPKELESSTTEDTEIVVNETPSVTANVEIPSEENLTPVGPVITLKSGLSEAGYSNDGWTYQWSDLPKSKVENGEEKTLYYYIKELTTGTFSTELDYTVTNGITAGVVIKNTPLTDVTVEKTWKYDDDSEIPEEKLAASVEMTLYRSTIAGIDVNANDFPNGMTKVGDTVQVTKEASWKYTWTNLEKVDENGNVYYYYVKEAKGNYEASITGNGVNGGAVSIENIVEKPVSISVEKIWSDGSASHTNDTVEINLYSSTISPAELLGEEEVTPTPSPEPEPTVTVIPEPTITETPEPEPTVTVIPEPTITETPEPTVTEAPEPTVSPSQERTVSVYFDGTDSSYKSPLVEKTITTDKAEIKIAFDYIPNLSHDNMNMWEETSTGVTIASYWIEDNKSSGGYYYVCYEVSGITADCNLIFTWNNSYPLDGQNEYRSQINPLSEEDAVNYSVLRTAVYSSTSTETQVNYICPEGKTFVETITLGNSYGQNPGYSSDGWQYIWSDLPASDSNGDKLYYYIEEVTKDGYTTSYQYQYVDGDSSKGIELVTVTNTLVEENTTSISVKKAWSGIDTYDSYQVEVKLYYADGTAYDDTTVTLNSSNNWEYTWSDLPEGNYYVEEITVVDTSTDSTVNIKDGFTVTYANSSGNSVTEPEDAATASGLITITNTKKSQGITLPGTGSKYPLIYYSLGWLFLLVSVLWMALTLKKKT